MTTSFHDIIYQVDDPVATITLNRPEQLNAFTYRTLSEIRNAVELATADQRVVGIIFTGAGRAFSAGLDAAVLVEATSKTDRDEATASAEETPTSELPGIFSYLLEVPKPVISAVNGVAAGGGLILALMSDIRFASDAASVTTVFLKRGLIAEHGSSWLLPRMVGVGRALDLLWASDRIDAQTAADFGLFEQVVPAEDLLQTARAYLCKLAEVSAPAAIAESKRLVYRHLGTDYRSALQEANVSQERFVAGPDAAEGARSFIEKRSPSFRRLGDSSIPD